MVGQIGSLCSCPSISYWTWRRESLIFNLWYTDANLKNQNELRQRGVELCYTTENTEIRRGLVCILDLKAVAEASLSVAFEKHGILRTTTEQRDTQESVITDWVEISREIQEQFIKGSMCNYLEGHKVLGGNQMCLCRAVPKLLNFLPQ